ncbi:hypothetical protein, partial [Bradyrhizobium sp.]|uniref:hypothetical protein n=1 Tax=Bradyrhizobium sp. TaxID=376 RepID=UPI003C7923AB
TLEGLGYILARLGKAQEAVEVFSRLIPRLDSKVAWQRELEDRILILSSKLTTSPAETQAELAQSEEEAVRKLGLKEYHKSYTDTSRTSDWPKT